MSLNRRSEPADAPKSNYRNVALLRSKHPNQASAGLARTAALSRKGASKNAASEFDCRKEAASVTQEAQISIILTRFNISHQFSKG